jgi:hypothetical protein
VIAHARGEHLFPVSDHGVSRHRNDRHLAVHENAVEGLPLEKIERLPTVVGDGNLNAGFTQQRYRKFLIEGVVLYQQNARSGTASTVVNINIPRNPCRAARCTRIQRCIKGRRRFCVLQRGIPLFFGP